MEVYYFNQESRFRESPLLYPSYELEEQDLRNLVNELETTPKEVLNSNPAIGLLQSATAVDDLTFRVHDIKIETRIFKEYDEWDKEPFSYVKTSITGKPEAEINGEKMTLVGASGRAELITFEIIDADVEHPLFWASTIWPDSSMDQYRMEKRIDIGIYLPKDMFKPLYQSSLPINEIVIKFKPKSRQPWFYRYAFNNSGRNPVSELIVICPSDACRYSDKDTVKTRKKDEDHCAFDISIKQ